MQLRKLIRLLLEAQAEHGGHIETCIDRKFAESQCEDFRYISISDVERHSCIWNPEESVNEIQRNVLVLGNE